MIEATSGSKRAPAAEGSPEADKGADRVVTPRPRPEDGHEERSLRPRRLAEYIGQDRVKSTLDIFLRAAKARGEPLDHLLLYGPPGLGKTTLAAIVAAELGVSLRITSGPAVERQGDLVSILTNLKPGDVLFIDEIHRLNRVVEEVLYSAMEDFAVDIVLGKGPAARTMRIKLPRFTLVGATTRLALLSGPLRDRFGVVLRLDFYEPEAMEEIVVRSAQVLAVPIEAEGARAVARRSRGTPRVANRLLKRVRDFAQVRSEGAITAGLAAEALRLLDVDEEGLDEIDRRVLLAIVDKFDGGPVGLETLAAAVGEDTDTIMDVYEPYLIQLGLLQRTARGRVATARAYAHLNLTPPARSGDAVQPSYFDRP